VSGQRNLVWIDVGIAQSLANVIGDAAKSLHVASYYDSKFHKAFVFQHRSGFYDWKLYRTGKGLIIATLTVLPDHRVRVDYHGGRPSEILYL
jgi:hypothetical protein